MAGESPQLRSAAPSADPAQRQGRSGCAAGRLGERGINRNFTPRAGFKSWNSSLLREGLVDELVLYLAPCLIGHEASGLFNLPELATLDGKRRLQIRDLRQVGAGYPGLPVQHGRGPQRRPHFAIFLEADGPPFHGPARRAATVARSGIRPIPAASLSASAACMVPTMPVSGAKPMTAQRTSSTSWPSGTGSGSTVSRRGAGRETLIWPSKRMAALLIPEAFGDAHRPG